MNYYISAFPKIRAKLYESFDTLFGIHNPFKKTPPKPHWEDKTDDLVLPGTVLPDDFFEGVREPTQEEYENIKILYDGGEEGEDREVEAPEEKKLKREGGEKAIKEKVIVINEGEEGVDELEKMIKDGSVEFEEINEVGDEDAEGGGE